MFDIMSKVLKHLYLAKLENLLYINIFENKLFRIYISPDSSKLSLKPNSDFLNNYKTNSEDIDFIVKINKIRKDHSFLRGSSFDFIIKSDFNEVDLNLNSFFRNSRKSSFKTRKCLNSLFVSSLQSVSFSNKPINLNLPFSEPNKIFIKKSLFEPKWKSLKFFKEENCYRILGIEPNQLQMKKWGFPYLSNNILDGVILVSRGKNY
jgi:hypothetical protein